MLNASAIPNSILTSGTSSITAYLTKNSTNEDLTILYPGKCVPNGIPVNFAGDAKGTVSPASNNTVNGAATTTFTAGTNSGVSNPSATVDSQTVYTNIFINSLGPVVTSVDPVNNAVNVPVNKVITIVFNQNIKAGNNWIELQNTSSGLMVPTTSISGNTLTITPTSVLANGISYYVLLHTGS